MDSYICSKKNDVRDFPIILHKFKWTLLYYKDLKVFISKGFFNREIQTLI